LAGEDRQPKRRQARPQVIEEILKLEGAEHCPVQFED